MGIFILITIAVILFLFIICGARIVPQRNVLILERLGKYHATLEPGFHFLIPLIDRAAYKHSLKEMVIDVPPQSCITKDNITVEVDGILYMQIQDPIRASYGINDYAFASTQLAQTTMRSEIGKIELDRTFEEREKINAEIVNALDKAAEPWGLKVTRHEIKNIGHSKGIYTIFNNLECPLLQGQLHTHFNIDLEKFFVRVNHAPS
jgi:regulator of protease activity HflC (stomatin/prohibitin superfamily)